MIKTSEKTDQIYLALFKACSTMDNPAKSADNPFYKSKYAPLEVVRETCLKPFCDNGLFFIQSNESVCSTEGKFLRIYTRIYHTSGQFIETTCDVPFGKMDPQGGGSTITYGRRYALQAALGVAAEEDDDANSALPQVPKKYTTPPNKIIQSSASGVRVQK